MSVLSVFDGIFHAGYYMILPRRHQSSQMTLYSFHNSFCSSHHSVVFIWTIFWHCWRTKIIPVITKCHHPRKVGNAYHPSGGLRCRCAEGYRAIDTCKYSASTSARKQLTNVILRSSAVEENLLSKRYISEGDFHNKTYCYRVDRGWAKEYTFLGGSRWYNRIWCPCIGVQNRVWQTQHLQNYTFARTGDLRVVFCLSKYRWW